MTINDLPASVKDIRAAVVILRRAVFEADSDIVTYSPYDVMARPHGNPEELRQEMVRAWTQVLVLAAARFYESPLMDGLADHRFDTFSKHPFRVMMALLDEAVNVIDEANSI